MDSIKVTNPYIRNGPSCSSFHSAVRISFDRSLLKLPALAFIVAEVLTIQAYSPSKTYEHLIDLPTAEIRRSRLNRRKFVVRARNRIFNIFCNTIEDADVWASILSHASSRSFNNHYRLGRKLADGRHSQIYLAYPHDGSSNEAAATFVVKVNSRAAENNDFINRSQFERDAHLMLVRDFDLSPLGSSPNPKEKRVDLEERKHREHKLSLCLDRIVTLRDSFGTPAEDFLVFEHQTGDILSKTLEIYGTLRECSARTVMLDLLTGLHFMHEQGVVHRDVRPSNVFYLNEDGHVRAKLFDLSEARQVPDGISGEEPFHDSPGELQYKSLEVLSGRYHGKPADIWSCGVLLYRILSGTLPFQGNDEQGLRKNITEQLLSQSLFTGPVWRTVTPEAISLVKQMLQPDPFKRPSAIGARSHQWLSNDLALRSEDSSPMQSSVSDESKEHSGGTATTSCQETAPVCLHPIVRPAPFTFRQKHKLCMTPTTSEGQESKSSDAFCTSESNVDLISSVGIPDRAEADGHKTIDSHPISEVTLDYSTTAKRTTVRTAADGSSRRTPMLKRMRESTYPLLVSSLNQRSRVERYEKIASMLVNKWFATRFLKRQLTYAEDPPTNLVSTADRRERSDDERSQQSARLSTESISSSSQTHPIRRQNLVQMSKLLPDRTRSCTRETYISGHGLTHRCNHLCNFRQCTRAKIMGKSLARVPSDSKMEPSKTRFPSPDRVSCERKLQRQGSPSDIVPTTKILDDDVYSWASNTKLFSPFNLKRAPVDPLFHFNGSNSPHFKSLDKEGKRPKDASTSTDPSRSFGSYFRSPGKEGKRPKDVTTCTDPSRLFGSHFRSPSKEGKRPKDATTCTERRNSASNILSPVRHIPLRNEMCTKTFVMKSVLVAAHVGLSEFSRCRPLVAKLLLRSPTAQLQLALILPYRRKLRTAGIALTAMFRIISLKKGTCLTRRVVRRQKLPTELLTLLTDIRLKCHMRPLRARIPNRMPPDEFDEMGTKAKHETNPSIKSAPHRFWDRQREVRLGIIIRAWDVARRRFLQLGAALGLANISVDEGVRADESDTIGREILVSRVRERIRKFFRRKVEEEVVLEEEEKYHHTLEMV